MRKGLHAIFLLFFFTIQANAQLGVMKLVGKNTKNYKLGFGGFIKTGFPVSDGSDVTLEIGADIFPLDGGNGEGTIMCPLKVGYRYTLNGTGKGFYVEPQVGFNVYGVTSLTDENGDDVNLKYHGVILAAGTGYLFSIWNTSFDVNLRYETAIAHGGSNNLVSLGLSKFFSFGRRNTKD
ncbi:MAG: hypothetical protein ABIN97_17770 [Ginsengibacter sp.]